MIEHPIVFYVGWMHTQSTNNLLAEDVLFIFECEWEWVPDVMERLKGANQKLICSNSKILPRRNLLEKWVFSNTDAHPQNHLFTRFKIKWMRVVFHFLHYYSTSTFRIANSERRHTFSWINEEPATIFFMRRAVYWFSHFRIINAWHDKFDRFSMYKSRTLTQSCIMRRFKFWVNEFFSIETSGIKPELNKSFYFWSNLLASWLSSYCHIPWRMVLVSFVWD